MKATQELERVPDRVLVEDADDSSRSPSQKDIQEEEGEVFQEEGHDEAKQDPKADTPKEAKSKEDRIILRLKVLALIFLALTAAGLGIATFFVTRTEEEDDFESTFRDQALEFIVVAQHNFNTIIQAMETFSVDITSLALIKNTNWPQMTIPHYSEKANDVRDLTNLTSLIFAPLVETDKSSWEIYAQSNSDLVAEGLDIPQSIHMDVENTGLAQFGPPPYLPCYQVSADEIDTSVVNFDFLSNTVVDSMVDRSQTLTEFQVSEIVGLSTALSSGLESPQSLVMQPTFSTFDADKTVAFVIGVLTWDTLFADTLHVEESSESMKIVLKSTCGSVHSYTVVGPKVIYDGPGDSHDSDYTFMRKSGTLGGNPSSDGENECIFSIDLYPTSDMEDSVTTNKPGVYSAIVIAVLIGTASFFVLYEWLAQRRQAKILAVVMRTTALVTSIFPSNVHDRLLNDKKKDVEKFEDEGEDEDDLYVVGKQGLKNFLKSESTPKDIPYADSKPIADLFPETTVMFADISGFTAWSSVREPTQVFTLLETVFQNFDLLARQRKVFKVETVGDSYVAVAGLPEPRKDHAVVMARFARDCMHKMNELVKKLELSLGPDTADLACRFGLHSGPCTAGVLRGERARFQLFGDTMNTAARMESTGKRNKIQLSPETAALLKEADKEHWLELRSDIIVAKGKGALQTYWLTPDARGKVEQTTPEEKEGVEKLDPKTEAELKAKKAKEMKEQRLIDWNCELLLQSLKTIVARRQTESKRRSGRVTTSKVGVKMLEKRVGDVGHALSEVQEIIALPENAEKTSIEGIDLGEEVPKQLRQYVSLLASMYKENSFHCFEHASHVTMSVSKLLSRIVAPDLQKEEGKSMANALHDHTYGITSDPLTQFAVVLSALIHDVDHRGVPNFILAKEEPSLATVYKGKSIAEQNSIDLAWRALMDPAYEQLRSCIYGNEAELQRFRHLIVNSVLATDIFDKELGELRKNRWKKAFHGENSNDAGRDEVNRKATIVIEHLIQASDVSHTMQHWHIYQKWSTRLLEEMYASYKEGRWDKDPTINWYEGELGFFDNYVIPLAKKLKECGVFGVASDEYLNYATENRREWEKKGQAQIEKFKAKHAPPPEDAPEEAPKLI